LIRRRWKMMLTKGTHLKGVKDILKYLSYYSIFFMISNIFITIIYAQPHEHIHLGWPPEIVWYYNSNTGFTYGDLIYSVDISSDGQFVAGGGVFIKGDPFRINLFRTYNGSLLRELRGHSDIVTSLDFSPIGDLLVSGSYDGTVRLWDINNGNLIKTFYIGSIVYSVCFSPNGQLIAIGEDLGFVTIYKINGELVKRFKAHPETTFSVVFSPDGQLLATGSDYPDFSIKIWRTSDWSLVKAITAEVGSRSLSFSSDGRFLASAGFDVNIRLWKIPEWELIIIRPPYTSSLAFSVKFAPNGNYLAVGSYALYNPEGWHDTIYFHDINGREILPSLGYRDFPVTYSVAFSPDGTYLASGMDGGIALWRITTSPTNRPPSIPVLLSPANNATVSPTPTFKVKSEDPDGDQVKFEIEVVKGSETKRFETGFFASGSEATFTVPENQSLSEGQWSWRARAIDSKGAASDWSDARKLIVTSAPIITFLLPISLHIGQEDHFFIVCQNITNQPWEGFAFIRIKLQNPTGIVKVAYRVWTLREENIITLATGETIDEITFPVEFIPPVGPNELKAFVVSIKSIQDTKIKRIEPYTTLILVGFAIYTAWKFYIARDLLETGATIELRRSVMLTFINAGYDIDPATADKIVKAIQQSLKERQEMNWIDRLQQLDFAYSVASKAYKLYEGQFPISNKDIAIGVLKKSVINFLKTADELMKTGKYIDEDLKIILREHRKEIEEILRVESSQPSSKSIGPEFIKGNQPLRYIQFFKPTSNNKMRSGEITELLIINPLDPNVDVNTFAFEGVSHPAALIEQQVDIQKREARWSFRLADIGSDEVWVQFSVLPKSDLPSGTQIRNKAIMKIGDREDQTNEIITTIDNTPPKVLMQFLDPIQQFNKFPIKWMYQDDIGEVDKVEIWISDDGKEPELWAIFPSSTTTITFQGKFGHEYKFYLVAIDKAGNQSSFPEQPLAITKAGQAPLIEKGLHLITLPIFSEISDPKQIFSFEANKWAWYDPITKKYSYYPETSASTLQPGKAFWVFFTFSHVPNAKGETVNDTQPFSVPLKQGWNLVGNPWLIPLNWDLEAIKVQQSNAIKSLKDAQAAGWIKDYAWGWEQDANNPNTGRYVLVYDTSIIPGVKGQLEPWKGYWVYAHTDCELILPPPSQSKGRGTRGEGRVAKGNGWSMRLQASVNGSVGEAVLGIANGTRGLAVGLPPEPPTGNNGVQVILLKNNTPLAVDVRSDGSRRQEWEVLVRFGTRDGGRGTRERKEVVLTFDGIGYAPKDVSAWLVDTVTGKRLYLRTQAGYRFVAQEGEVERKFKVVVERGNDRPLRVVGLKATPMRGQGVVIEFSLTKPAKVQAEVMTLMGRRVTVLDAPSSDGLTHRLVWRWTSSDGNKVGVAPYLIRILATDEEGRQVQAATVVKPK
jgi:WD40 repeat protein